MLLPTMMLSERVLPSNRHTHSICVLSNYVESNCLRDAILVDLNGIFALVEDQLQ